MRERYLPPILIQTVGLLLLIGAAVFWAVTGHESPLLVGAALTLIGIGAYSGVVVGLRNTAAQAQHQQAPPQPAPEDAPR